jgi:predicted MFS family arabinose efflux permease
MAERPSIYSYSELLRLPDVPQLLAATCLSRLGGRILILAVVLYTLSEFRSPALAGWVAFASMVPGMIVSPMAGVVIDRISPAKAIIVDMISSTTMILALVVGASANMLNEAALLGIMALYSVTSPLSAASIRVLWPTIVPPLARDRANAADASTFTFTDVAGPAAAGVVLGFAGPNITFLAVAAMYLGAAVCLHSLAGRTYAKSVNRRSLRMDAVAGLGYVLSHPTLRGLAATYSLYQVGWGVLYIAVPAFVYTKLGAQDQVDTVVGTLWALAGAAGTLGALYVGRLHLIGREQAIMAIGVLITAFVIYPFIAEFGILGLFIGLIVIGFLTGPIDVSLLALRQRRTDPEWFTRALAVSISLNMCGLPLGSALGGALVAYSINAAFIFAAAACLLSTVAVYFWIPRR